MATKEVNLGSVRGPQGAAATVTVGKVTTGAAGSSAAVTNSGTSGAAILNFTIPRGAQGNPTTVNGKSGASITLTAQDVGARPSSWTPSAGDVGALPKVAYSTAEVNTGKTWIDGKPIYRKSYAVAAFPDKGFVNVPLNISNLGQVVDYYGIASNGTNTIRVPYYSVDGDAYGIQMSVSENSTLVLKTNTDPEVGGDRSDFSGTVTVEYTKGG